MRKKSLTLALLTMVICLLSGCSCEHEWVNANCTTPKTCSLCQEAEGDPLGHNWQNATCTSAKICTNCSATEGTPLNHIPGTWQETIDLINCKQHKTQHCTVCNSLLHSEDNEIDTLIKDEQFIFTPKDFLERLISIAQNAFPDIHYELATDQDTLFIVLYYGDYKSYIQFFDSSTSPLSRSAFESAEVWCVALCEEVESNTDLRNAFYLACDPTLNEDSLYNIDTCRTAAFLNAIEFGELAGYLYANNLLYEFMFIPYQNGDETLLFFQILTYASNWAGAPVTDITF